MRRLLALVLLAATPLVAQKPTTQDTAVILAQENLFWTNYATGDTTALTQQLLPDFQNVEQEIWSRDQVLKFLHFFTATAHCGLAPVKIEDPHITFLDPATATIVYHATESPTCNGKTMSGNTNITTLWRFVRGANGEPARWQMQLHTEYAIPADSKPSGF